MTTALDMGLNERLPNINLLKGFDERMKREVYEKGSSDVDDAIRDEASARIVEETTAAAKVTTYYTIHLLAKAFATGNAFLQDLPSVVLYDQTSMARASNNEVRAINPNSDADYDIGESSFPTTAFCPRGNPQLEQPEGPVIAYNIHKLDYISLIEESFHFLQWFYTTRDLEKWLRVPRTRTKKEGDLDEGKIVCKRKKEGGIFIAKVVKPSYIATTTDRIVHEASANFAVRLFGLERDYPDCLDEKRFGELYRTLINSGRHSFFFNAKRFYDIPHGIGYRLGDSLYTSTRSLADLRSLSPLIFRRSITPAKKLDEMIKYVKRN